jgi:catechol-2,3-dioxygenase
MRVTGLNHYNLRAHQPLLDELCRFYVEIVGLSVGDRPPFAVAGYWLYANGHPVLHLAEASAAEIATTEIGGTFAHAAFDCVDVASAEALLTLRGLRYRKTAVPESGAPQIFFTDPAGNGVELLFPAAEASRSTPK